MTVFHKQLQLSENSEDRKQRLNRTHPQLRHIVG